MKIASDTGVGAGSASAEAGDEGFAQALRGSGSETVDRIGVTEPNPSTRTFPSIAGALGGDGTRTGSSMPFETIGIPTIGTRTGAGAPSTEVPAGGLGTSGTRTGTGTPSTEAPVGGLGTSGTHTSPEEPFPEAPVGGAGTSGSHPDPEVPSTEAPVGGAGTSGTHSGPETSPTPAPASGTAASGAQTGAQTALQGAESASMQEVTASMSGLESDVGALKNSPTAKAQLAALQQQIKSAGDPPSADDLKNIQDSLAKLQTTLKADKDISNADVTRLSQQIGMVAQGLAGAGSISQIVFQGIGDNNALNSAAA